MIRALLTTALSSAAGWAGEFDEFGPEDFVRENGRPSMQVRIITILNPSGPHTLRIDNGGANGQFRKVSSGTIWLNGVRIVGPSRFNQNVSEIVLPVTLSKENRLDVELQSKPGSGLTIRVIGADNDPPTITALVSPAANAAGWHNADATVSFQCSDGGSGIASCSGPVIVTTEGGQQVVTGTAVDRAGNSASVSATVNLDKTPPVLSDFLPSDGATLPDPEVNLTGEVGELLSGVQTTTCSANNTTEVADLNDQMIGDEQVFACTLPLVPGSNLINVLATDIAGNMATSSLIIQHVLRPAVSIDSPDDLDFFFLSPVTVTGTVDDPGATVEVNDIPASVTNGVFTASVPLSSGFHTITAVGRNVAGSGSDSVQVFVVFGTVPTVGIDFPSEGFVLGDVETNPPVPVTVRGWVRENRAQCLLFPCEAPDVTVQFNNSSVSASVSQGTSLFCLSGQVCWKYSATQAFPPPVGTPLTIEVEAETGGGSASRQVSGMVDFCVNGDGGCQGAALFQGCDQNRRCIVHSDGCSNPVFPGRKDDPTQGMLGRISTEFGRHEGNLPEGAPTVFGQRRPIQLPCNRHDECYHQRCPQEQTRAGMVADKLDCDDRFYGDMQDVCRRAYPETTCPVSRIGLLNCPQWRLEKTACYGWARAYVEGVNFNSNLYIGLPPYQDPQTLEACIDCPTID